MMFWIAAVCVALWVYRRSKTKFSYTGNRRGIRFFQMYDREFKYLERAKCLLLGHQTDYRLIDIRRATAFWNFSKYKWTVGHCSRCGLGWEDWNRFPYGSPLKDKDGNVVDYEDSNA